MGGDALESCMWSSLLLDFAAKLNARNGSILNVPAVLLHQQADATTYLLLHELMHSLSRLGVEAADKTSTHKATSGPARHFDLRRNKRSNSSYQ